MLRATYMYGICERKIKLKVLSAISLSYFIICNHRGIHICIHSRLVQGDTVATICHGHDRDRDHGVFLHLKESVYPI